MGNRSLSNNERNGENHFITYTSTKDPASSWAVDRITWSSSAVMELWSYGVMELWSYGCSDFSSNFLLSSQFMQRGREEFQVHKTIKVSQWTFNSFDIYTLFLSTNPMKRPKTTMCWFIIDLHTPQPTGPWRQHHCAFIGDFPAAHSWCSSDRNKIQVRSDDTS